MRYLKQNTDQYVTVGPFCDKTDGLTTKDDLTVTNIAYVLSISTHAGASTHASGTCSATAANDYGLAGIGHGGMYDIKLPDADLNFVGSCKLTLTYPTAYLPVFEEFMVIPANAWDAMMGTDYLQVDSVQTNGTNQTAGVIPTVGTGAGQISLASGTLAVKLAVTLDAADVTGNVKSDLQTIATKAVSCTTDVTVSEFVGNAGAILNVTDANEAYINTDSIATAVWAAVTSGLTGVGSVGKWLLDNMLLKSIWSDTKGATMPTSGTIAVAGAQMTLTTAAQNALVAAIEVELANDSTGQAFLEAIAAKMNADFSLSGLTTTAIRDAILNRVLAGNHDTAGTPGKLLQTASTLAAGAKMDIVDAPNATAVTAIQNGLSKPLTAQTITAPADMALNSTVAKRGDKLQRGTITSGE